MRQIKNKQKMQNTMQNGNVKASKRSENGKYHKFSEYLFNIATKNLLFNQIYLIYLWCGLSKTKKLQGSIEYIMILSAVTIIVVIALSMMTQLKGTVLHSFYNNTTNQSASQLLSHELKNLSNV